MTGRLPTFAVSNGHRKRSAPSAAWPTAMTGSRPCGSRQCRAQALAQSNVCGPVQGAIACRRFQSSSTLARSPVMRSDTRPTLVVTAIGPFDSIRRRAISASVRKRAVELIRWRRPLDGYWSRREGGIVRQSFLKEAPSQWGIPGRNDGRAGLMVDGAKRRAALAKIKTAMMKAAMSGLYHTGAHRLLAPYTQGVGLIFTLHQVHPEPAEPKAFAPNRILEVTPGFLDAVIDQVQEAGLDIVSLDEAVRRLREEDPRRFVSFTFDDGYRDNLEYAYPLFRKRSLPLTLYVPTDYPDGKGELWWITLEEIVTRAEEIELCRDGTLWKLAARTVPEKYRAYNEIYWWLRRIDEATQRQVVRALAERYDVDMGADCRRLIMGWDEIRQLAEDPLVTIGAHTKSHFAI